MDSKGSYYCKGECEWNYKSDECQTRVVQHGYIAIRDPIHPPNNQTIRGPYSNITLAEKDLKEFEANGGRSMILKTVDGIIQEDKNTIELVNDKKTSRDYENMNHAQSLIQSVKNKCK